MKLSWKIEQQGAALNVTMRGWISEDSDLSLLANELGTSQASEVVLDMKDVARINSLGVREWLLFVKSMAGTPVVLSLTRCSLPFVQQLGMIRGFAGNASVLSLHVPYYCEACDREEVALWEPTSGIGVGDAHNCSSCGSKMTVDDLPDYYTELAAASA